MISSDFPLVLFTVLMQCAVGLSFVGACRGVRGMTEGLARLWFFAFVLAGLGLVASLFHLTMIFEAHTALNNLGVSWLSNEGLVAGAFFGGAVLTALTAWKSASISKVLGLMTAILGLGTLVAQGLTYAPEAMPAINNGFPLALFVMTSLVAGAGLGRVLVEDECGCLAASYKTALWVLMALLLVVPCVWASGSEAMRLTARAWGGTPFFWGAGACFLLARLTAKKTIISVALALVGLFLSRMVFFVCTVHMGTMLGFPY